MRCDLNWLWVPWGAWLIVLLCMNYIVLYCDEGNCNWCEL